MVTDPRIGSAYMRSVERQFLAFATGLLVSGATAWYTLVGLTLLLLGLGMVVFARREYLDAA